MYFCGDGNKTKDRLLGCRVREDGDGSQCVRRLIRETVPVSQADLVKAEEKGLPFGDGDIPDVMKDDFGLIMMPLFWHGTVGTSCQRKSKKVG